MTIPLRTPEFEAGLAECERVNGDKTKSSGNPFEPETDVFFDWNLGWNRGIRRIMAREDEEKRQRRCSR